MLTIALLSLALLTVALLASAAGGRTDSMYRIGSKTSTLSDPSADQEVRYWHRLAVKRLRLLGDRERRLGVLRRELLHRGSVSEALNLACTVYGHCTELWSKARCESRMFAQAHNPSGASGLFQFLPSTFASTPYAHFSIWSPYASALAAGWMHTHGRGGEWVCR